MRKLCNDILHEFAFWWGNLTQGYYVEDLGIGGRPILKLVLKKWAGRAGLY
jgi:hypothetical protein